MKKIEYKVCGGTNGFVELEREVSTLLNTGWKPVGGIAFNSGFPYQALARVMEYKEKPSPTATSKPGQTKTAKLNANSAMRKLDDLT